MCGLATILDWKLGGWLSKLEAERAVRHALLRMQYRGLPGRFKITTSENGKCILGHVRLPIVNLSQEADQPYVDPETGTQTLFVGEIFNYQDLDYVHNGAVKKSKSDTEALSRAFLTAGINFFHAFDGFWSAVFAEKDRITVVTDYLSQKPLYFHPGKLMIASEPAAIAYALPETPLPCELYFSNVLKWGYDPTGLTPWEGIIQIPAGTALAFQNGEWTMRKYWNWSKVARCNNFREALIDSVRNRLKGDLPVSLLLSGGLDSTVIFKIITWLLKREVQTFHVDNGEQQYVHIALSGSDSIALSCPYVSVSEALTVHQVPVDLGSMVPQLALAKAVKQHHFNVVLSGDGADELFGGYNRAKEYDSQHSDVFMELPYYHLPRLDRIMMSQTIELRSPFLAPAIVKYALGLPWEKRQNKELLRTTFRDIVPPEICKREKVALKAPAVTKGGIAYRQSLINLWRQSL